MLRTRWIGIPVLFIAAELASANEVRYTLTDLGPAGGHHSDAQAINRHGHVTGRAFDATGQFAAFLYTSAGMRSLGTLGSGGSWGFDINDSDQIVGSGGAPFLYADGQMTRLQYAWTANAINNHTQIAGSRGQNHVDLHAYVTTGGPGGGTIIDLPPVPGFPYSVANDVNNSGVVVGSGYFYNTTSSAFLWTPTDGIRLILPHDNGSTAWAINDAGDVVGIASSGAFLYRDGVVHDLAALTGGRFFNAFDINNAGSIVGYGWTPHGVFGALYEDGILYDLNDLVPPGTDADLEHPYGINDAGQIVGEGFIGGVGHAFLLTPIPEPAGTIAITLLALLLLSRSREWSLTISQAQAARSLR
jgi:probable HAF family extracellular repeat protein